MPVESRCGSIDTSRAVASDQLESIAVTGTESISVPVGTNVMVGQNKPLLGYISIRVCPPTARLMGMQQYAPHSVMTEVVAYRSPEANVIMDLIQAKVLEMNRKDRLQAMLHWGLENQLLRASDLPLTPLGNAINSNSTISKLDAFKAVRKFLTNGHPAVFDNHFVARLQL